MSHTPTVPVDERAARLLDRTPVPEDHRERMVALVHAAAAAAKKAGKDLQSEFGREAVALIVGCNQFVRLYREGPAAGRVEFLLDPTDRQALEGAGYPLGESAGGMVFRMFGWASVDPMQDGADPAALEAAVQAAFGRATRA